LVVISITMLHSCVPSNPTNPIPTSTISYANACCCNTIITAGTGKIFIPSLFTPNLDGLNDVLYIAGDSNVKYITNCIIKDSVGAIITVIDTAKQGKFWDGFYNNGNFYRGVCKVQCDVTDNTNSVITINGTSSVFTCDSNINQLPNATNCKLPDQLDPVSFTPNYPSGESCF
jgi:gliding motility-associated-like protein